MYIKSLKKCILKVLKNVYLPRLLDKKIDDYLGAFGAISIEGPKWCGKTWLSFKHAKSSVFLDDAETFAHTMAKLALLSDMETCMHILPEDSTQLLEILKRDKKGTVIKDASSHEINNQERIHL